MSNVDVVVEVETDSEEYAFEHCCICDKQFDINSNEPVFYVSTTHDPDVEHTLCNKCRKLLAQKLIGGFKMR